MTRFTTLLASTALLTGAAFAQTLADARAAKGSAFNICDVQPAAEVSGA